MYHLGKILIGYILQEHYRKECGHHIAPIDTIDNENSDFDHHWKQSKKRPKLFIACDANFFKDVSSTYMVLHNINEQVLFLSFIFVRFFLSILFIHQNFLQLGQQNLVIQVGKEAGLELGMASVVSLRGFNFVAIAIQTPYLNLSKHSYELLQLDSSLLEVVLVTDIN